MLRFEKVTRVTMVVLPADHSAFVDVTVPTKIVCAFLVSSEMVCGITSEANPVAGNTRVRRSATTLLVSMGALKAYTRV
jgi:hypothetical protein